MLLDITTLSLTCITNITFKFIIHLFTFFMAYFYQKKFLIKAMKLLICILNEKIYETF